jgi:hypothetical protein
MDYYRDPDSIEAAATARRCLSRLAAMLQEIPAEASTSAEPVTGRARATGASQAESEEPMVCALE